MSTVKFFVILLNLFSAIMTGVGYYSFLEPWADRLLDLDKAWLVSIFVAGTISFGIQGLVHTFWWRVGAEGLLRSPLSLAAAVLVSLASWFGSAGGFVMMMNYADLVAEEGRATTAATAAPMRSFADSYNALAHDVHAMSELATALAEREREVGGTCDNDTEVGGSCGPRCRLRQRHAETLAETSAMAAELADQSREISIAMATATDIAAQRAHYADALRLQGNPEQRDIRDRLQRVAGELGSPVTDPVTDASFSCDDPDFVARLEALVERTATRPDLPEIAPQEASADMSDALHCVGARLGAVMGLATPCEGGIAGASMLSAGGLETLIIIFMLAETTRKRRLGAVPTQPQLFQKAGHSPRNGAELEEGRWLLHAYGLYVVEADRRQRFMAAPIDGDIAAWAEATRLARYFGEYAPKHIEVPLAELSPGWSRARAETFGHATLFNLYRWPRVADLRIRQAERDVAKARFHQDHS